MAANAEGQNFAGYEILAKLGQGGMGAVFKARQPMLDRLVALKVLMPELGNDPEFVSRFKREAASAAALHHPNLVQIYTSGEFEGTHYMAMEYVEGETLHAHIERHGRLDAREAVAITVYVAQALQYAWNKAKLIHRDIKPDNIFLSNSAEVRVGDLGLAKKVGDETTGLTQTGIMMGSPHYISPEQARGAKEIDFRADIYSLGCTLYHMLTGRPPYEGGEAMVIIAKHITEPPPAIFKVWPECPTALGMVVGKMLAKNRSDRYASYEALIKELLQVREKLDGAVSTVRSAMPAVGVSTPSAGIPARPARRISPALIVAMAVLVVALGAGVVWWAPWKQPTAAPDVTDRGYQQFDQVLGELKKVNPEFDGKGSHDFDGDQLVELLLSKPGAPALVENLTPVRSLPKLRKLSCSGWSFWFSTKPSPLSDLTPLQGLGLTWLDISVTKVNDLTPLKGMLLTYLDCGFTGVKDLSPLQGMKLTTLLCNNSKVEDLSLVQQMPLENLSFAGDPIKDLGFLKGMRLQELNCSWSVMTDLSVLKEMPLKSLHCHFTRVSDLSPLKGTPLKLLGCTFSTVKDFSPLKETSIEELICDVATATLPSNEQVLKEIPTLKKINNMPVSEFWQKAAAGTLPGQKPHPKTGSAGR